MAAALVLSLLLPTEQKVIRAKVGVLELAKQLGKCRRPAG